MKNVAIILGAGQSKRCGFDKIFYEHLGISNLDKCLNTFSQSDLVDEIIIVINDDQSLSTANKKLASAIIKGGKERFLSVKNAIEYCAQNYDKNLRLIFHNAANPHLTLSDLEAGIDLSQNKKNVIFGYFTPNSIKEVQNGKITACLDRSTIFETQTPQISDLETLTKALKEIPPTQVPKDEAELLEILGEDIYVYECAPSNTKTTYAHDFKHPGKTGLGEDSHRFASQFIKDKPFRLGGIDVSDQKLSSDGNSDGDVIFHALCNALLSAHGDKTFDPIAAPICKAGDTNSESYLKATLKHLGKIEINQVLISLEGAQPKIAPHHDRIQKNLAQLLDLKIDKIGLTYTTGEALSDIGRGLGIKSFVVVMIK